MSDTKDGRTIETHCLCPPIPIRKFDWCAYYDGEEEGLCGYGATEPEAIADLKQQDMDVNYTNPHHSDASPGAAIARSPPSGTAAPVSNSEEKCNG
jgi:hypothetical protein